jgi:hypothetical protein
VQLTNSSVSRRHCVIEKREGQWSLIDEDSRNNTFVNGQRVNQRRKLTHGDVVELGEVMLRVGLDRPLKDEASRSGKANLPSIVRMISIFVMLSVLGMAGLAGTLLYGYQQRMGAITSKLPVALGNEVSMDFFLKSGDERKITYKPIQPLPISRELPPLTFDNPVPEWDTSDIWSTGVIGREPRLFNGLDLNLEGGAQIVLSGYFFHQRLYYARDSTDPRGMLNIELEGWSGFGERYGQKDLPASRQYELPHYVQSIDLYPDQFKTIQHGEFEGVEQADFHWIQTISPPPPTDATAPAASEKWIKPMEEAPQAQPTLMIGRYYSFYKDGCRYSLVVRGSANLINRFEGGLDALATALFGSLKIDPISPVVQPALPEDLKTQMLTLNTMLVAYDRKPDVLDVVTFEDLMKVRDWLLKFQKFPEPLADEAELRRLYFKIRDKAQQGLEISLGRAYDGRNQTKSDIGERELLKINDFMGNYPPLTMKRGTPGYPEWAWYFEEATRVRPYTTLASAKARDKLR